MRVSFCIYLFIYFLLGGGLLIAQHQQLPKTDSLQVLSTSEYPIQSLRKYTQVFVDTTRSVSIEDLLNNSEAIPFKPLEETVMQTLDPIWLKVTLTPTTTKKDWLLVFKRPYEWFQYHAALDSVKLFVVKEGRLLREETTGMYIPRSQKSIQHPIPRIAFKVHLQKDESVTFYCKILDHTDAFLEMELVEPTISLPEPNNAQIEWMSAFALILSIYVLAFFFYTKDTSYLYLFVLFFLVFWHYQVLHSDVRIIDWLFPEHPSWSEIAWIVCTSGTFICFLQFARSITQLKKILPLWDRIIRFAIVLSFIVLFVRIALWIGNKPFYHQYAIFSVGVVFICNLIIVVRLWFVKHVLVRYVSFAGIWLFFFSILGILWQVEIIPFFDTPNPWIIAQTGFMLILSLSIARKMQLSERAKSEVEKVREIDSIKSKFFANISHEFRTPLSLILGPINQSLESIPASEAVDHSTEVPVKGKHLKVMKRNALRLQNLVDQILDLSKLDQGEMRLQVAKGDLISFLRSLVFSFESLTELKHITFRTHFPESIAESYFDADKVEKIVVNLLSNAIKFTPEHGEVSVIVEALEGEVKFSVSDTGPGMTAEETQHIFNRFYQTETTQDQGTGIGLALVKELVELHQGQISVNSMKAEGTTFKVLIPYRMEVFPKESLIAEPISSLPTALPIELAASEETLPEGSTPPNDQLPMVLVVEDNPDLRNYISEQLVTHFQVITAKDGKEGIQLAETKVPDLIVSDVMMPKVSGIELCEHLKKDIKTSHIPIILLTAKADQGSKMQGLTTGADDYLTKPFDGRELRVRAQNLIELRKTLREKFAGELKIHPTKVVASSMEERFMKQILEVIETQMDNEYFSVEELAQAVGFSRSQLNRKLKGLIGKSPNQLIREFRLTRAKELLEQQIGAVSEVAYQVGYSNLSYFSKSFKEQFGILPSEV